MFRFIKLWSSLIVNILVLFVLIRLKHALFIPPISITIGLVCGEILILSHGWKKIDIWDHPYEWEQEPHPPYRPQLLWLTCITGHVLYAFMACVVFLIIKSTVEIPSGFEMITAFGIGCTLPSFQFLS